MPSIIRNALTTCFAIAGLATPQIVQAQSCLEQADIADAAIYAMPIAIVSMQDKCGTRLSSEGFLATKGSMVRERYVALQDDSWPGALRVLTMLVQSNGGNAGMGEMIASMPSETIRPFADAILQQKLSENLDVSNCQRYEQLFEMVSFMDPRKSADMVAGLFDFAGGNAGGKPAIMCSSDKK